MISWWRDTEQPWVPLYDRLAEFYPKRQGQAYPVPCPAEMGCRVRILECSPQCDWYHRGTGMRQRAPGFWDPAVLAAGFALPQASSPAEATWDLARTWVERLQVGSIWVSGPYRDTAITQLVRLVMLYGEFSQTGLPGIPQPWYVTTRSAFSPSDGGLVIEVRKGQGSRWLRTRRREGVRWLIGSTPEPIGSLAGSAWWLHADAMATLYTEGSLGWTSVETWPWNPEPWPVVLWTDWLQTWEWNHPDPAAPHHETALAWAERIHFPLPDVSLLSTSIKKVGDPGC